MSRTTAEAARDKNLSQLNHTLMVKHVEKSKKELDLSMLPTETQMKICLLRVERGITGERTLYVTDDESEVSNALTIKTNQITLRQAKYMMARPKDPKKVTTFVEEMGVTMNLPRFDGRGKVELTTFLNGKSVHMLSTAINSAVNRQVSAHDVDAFLDSIEADHARFAFIGQHTIGFPGSFKDRPAVSFLGLPHGTKLHTKRGATFRVMQRDLVHVPTDNVARGLLAVVAENPEAGDLVAKEGWAVAMYGTTPCAMVPDHLMTHSERDKFLIQDIKVPYSDPTFGYGDLFGQGAELRTNLLANSFVKSGPKQVYYANEDDLRDSLDDFLFG